MTKIGELLGRGATYSVEFMPPRSDEMLRQLEKTIRELQPLTPSFCSVTYGAGGSTRERTAEAVSYIHHDTPLLAMPHLTCVGQTRDEIEGLVCHYAGDGIENLLALAGDPPKDGPVTGDFRYAVELIELARTVGDFSIGVSAFPEVHPMSPDRDTDRARLADKLAQADFGITQFFWNADHYFRMIDELDAIGCTTPVIPSLFPILNVATAQRFTATNGAEWPSWLQDRFDVVGDDQEDVRRAGVEIACEIGSALLGQGVPGLHIYSMNRSASVQEIWASLGLGSRP
ncbi:MAG TPA: methylenetetrahydrofolate reductase [Acidimicrobiales bacterium]